MATSKNRLDQVVLHEAKEEVFLEHPIFDDQSCLPFQYVTLHLYQQHNPLFLQLPVQKPEEYVLENMGRYLLVCYKQGQRCHICLTDEMLPKTVKWFHEATVHNAGISHLEDQLLLHFNHPKLSSEIQ